MCYLAAVPRFERDELLSICHDIVKKNNLTPIKDQIFEANEFHDFVRNLRGNEVAIVPLLPGLAIKKGSGVTIQFFINERKIYDRAGMIIAIDTTKPSALANTTTVSTEDNAAWYKLLTKVALTISRGRELKTVKAKQMERAKHAKHGLVDVWAQRKGTAEYLAHAHIWGNLAISPEAAAKSMFPDPELQKASSNTLREIFGGRKECALWLKQLSNAKE